MARVVAEAVSDIVNNHLQDPRIEGLISITEVRMTPDLKNAHVHLSIMGVTASSEKKSFLAVEHAAGYIQSLLGQRITSKFCPHLSFHIDDRLKRGTETMKMINEVLDQPQDIEDTATQNDIGDITK